MLEQRISGTAAEELPPPSAELNILAALVHAYLRQLPKRKRAAFMDEVEEIVAQHAAMAKVTRIRPASQDAAKADAANRAAAWVKMAREVFEAMER
jgi:hypothetical protein